MEKEKQPPALQPEWVRYHNPKYPGQVLDVYVLREIDGGYDNAVWFAQTLQFWLKRYFPVEPPVVLYDYDDESHYIHWGYECWCKVETGVHLVIRLGPSPSQYGFSLRFDTQDAAEFENDYHDDGWQIDLSTQSSNSAA